MKNEIVEVKHLFSCGSNFAYLVKQTALDMQSKGLTVEVQYSEDNDGFSALILGRKPE